MTRRQLLIIPLVALGLAGMATALQGPTLWDVEAVRSFQGHGVLSLPMEAVTTVGSEGFLLGLTLLVFWCINKPLGIDMALLLIITGAVNITLKALLQGQRPFWSDLTLRLTSAASFSTPSGHAAHATVLFGYLAWWLVGRRSQEGQPTGSLLRGLTAALLLLCILLVCLSRVYLGVHFPGDVIWGCAEGIVILLAFIGLKPQVAAWLGGRSLGMHVVLAAGAAAALLTLNLLFLNRQQATPFGVANAFLYPGTRSQAMDEAGSLAGLVLGAWVGLALERRYVRFTTSGPAGRRALRYGLGLAGLLAIGLGLLILLPGETLVFGLALRIVGAAAAALWAVFIWPWLFVRIGW